MSDKENKAEVSLIKKCMAIFAILLLPALAYVVMTLGQPHRAFEELEPVIGYVQQVRTPSSSRRFQRAETYITVNNKIFVLPGHYNLEYLQQNREPVRLFVDGRDTWVLQTREHTLLGYLDAEQRYRNLRRIDYGLALAIMLGFFSLIFTMVRRVMKGESAFSRKKY
ncbi:MAG: hypothetical protein JJU03_02900 [Idiomarina sp.]|nr:hypothetical protein [Idiomarina sp.]